MGFFFEKSESMTESKSESMTEGRTGESTFERGYLGETEASQVTADAYSDGGYDGSVMSDAKVKLVCDWCGKSFFRYRSIVKGKKHFFLGKTITEEWKVKEEMPVEVRAT